MVDHPKNFYEFWEKVKAECGIREDFTDAWGFGDTPELKQELLDLILKGKKRASNLLIESELVEYPPSGVGQFHVILNGEDVPTAVIQTVSLRKAKFKDVDADQAYWEGEGDRSVESYLKEHVKYYTRVGKTLGFDFHEDLEVEFERFELVYPCDKPDLGNQLEK